MAGKLSNPKSVKAVAKSHQDFTEKIYPKLVEQNGSDKNMVTSTFSLSACLAMLHAGCAGNTLKQVNEISEFISCFG